MHPESIETSSQIMVAMLRSFSTFPTCPKLLQEYPSQRWRSWSHFQILFLRRFQDLWVPLGSLPGLPKALLGRPWTPKAFKKTYCFLMFLQMQEFWFLKLSMALSWANLVPEWSLHGAKSNPKIVLRHALTIEHVHPRYMCKCSACCFVLTDRIIAVTGQGTTLLTRKLDRYSCLTRGCWRCGR